MIAQQRGVIRVSHTTASNTGAIDPFTGRKAFKAPAVYSIMGVIEGDPVLKYPGFNEIPVRYLRFINKLELEYLKRQGVRFIFG